MTFGVYRKVYGRTGVGMLYQFLMLARHHTTGAEFVVYIPLRIEYDWRGTIRPCILERAAFDRKFEYVSEGLPTDERYYTTVKIQVEAVNPFDPPWLAEQHIEWEKLSVQKLDAMTIRTGNETALNRRAEAELKRRGYRFNASEARWEKTE